MTATRDVTSREAADSNRCACCGLFFSFFLFSLSFSTHSKRKNQETRAKDSQIVTLTVTQNVSSISVRFRLGYTVSHGTKHEPTYVYTNRRDTILMRYEHDHRERQRPLSLCVSRSPTCRTGAWLLPSGGGKAVATAMPMQINSAGRTICDKKALPSRRTLWTRFVTTARARCSSRGTPEEWQEEQSASNEAIPTNG